MFASILAALMLSPQVPTITFESSGITVMAFCAELERQTGRRFRAWDEVRNELLALRLTSAPLDTVLQKLTYAARARVRADGTTYDIRPDSAAIAKTQAEVFAGRVQIAQEAIDSIKASIRAQPLSPGTATRITRDHVQAENRTPEGENPEARDAEQFGSQTPESQALVKMFCAIPAKELAAIRPGDREVWSTTPTAMEHQGPPDGTHVIQELDADAATWCEALLQAATLSTNLNRHYYANPDLASAAMLRLEVEVDIEGNLIANLGAFDSAGAEVGIARRYFYRPEREVEVRADKHLPVIDVRGAAGMALELNWPGAEAWKKKPPADVDNRDFAGMFFQPEAFDPVGLTFGRCLIELSKAEDEQLVAGEDSMMALARWGIGQTSGSLDLAAFRTWLAHPGFAFAADQPVPLAEFTDADGWIQARPHVLDLAADFEIDRAALGRFLRSVRQTGAVTLADQATLQAACGRRFGGWSRWFRGGLLWFMPDCYALGIAQDESKRFLGLLDDAQLDLAQGNGLHLAACSQAARDELWWEFGTGSFNFESKDLHHRELLNHRTRALPSGLPGHGMMHITMTQERRCRVRTAKNYWGEMAGRNAVDAIGVIGRTLRAFREKGIELRPILVTTYKLEFDFPDGILTSASIESGEWAGAPAKSLEELPKKFQEDILGGFRHYLHERFPNEPPD